jgi:hypothetical protein
VTERCLYGVDLNPLAVELAKLSLWLHTVSRDRPLSFLDHHLRPGNSLVGAGGHDFATTPPRPNAKKKKKSDDDDGLWTGESLFVQNAAIAMTFLNHLEAMRGRTVEEVKQQEKDYAEAREALLGKFGDVAALATAIRTGAVNPGDASWTALADYALNGGEAPVPEFAAWVESAREAAKAWRYFHWELEFPEAFFDRFGGSLQKEAGFDAVIGNPPYVRQERLIALKPYLQLAFPEVFHGVADLFVYFFEQGFRRLKPGARLAYICSNSWLQTGFAEPLRRRLRQEATVVEVLDLGNNRTFREAPDVCPSIFVLEKAPPPEGWAFESVVFERGEEPVLTGAVLGPKAVHVTQHDQPDAGWQLEDRRGRDLLAKLMGQGRTLGEVTGNRLYYGIKTGLNEAFIVVQATRDQLVREDPASTSLLRKMVRGEDLRPWYQEDEGRWLVALPNGWTRQTFGDVQSEAAGWRELEKRHGALAAYLGPFAEKGRARQDQGEYWWELRACAYYAEFDRPKILWPDIAKVPRFSGSDDGLYLGNTAYFTPEPLPGLLAFLQSRCAWAMISRVCVHVGTRAGLKRYRLFTEYLANLRVPEFDPETKSRLNELEARLINLSRDRYGTVSNHQRRVFRDLRLDNGIATQRLTRWWELNWSGFRQEVKQSFGQDVPFDDRDKWESLLASQRSTFERLTSAIVDGERELNDRVYRLYGLDADEIKLIEETTKYQYGEV